MKKLLILLLFLPSCSRFPNSYYEGYYNGCKEALTRLVKEANGDDVIFDYQKQYVEYKCKMQTNDEKSKNDNPSRR